MSSILPFVPGIPLLVLKNVVIFPQNVVPVVVGRFESIKAIEESVLRSEGKEICIGTQKKIDGEEINVENIYLTGISGSILQIVRMQKGAFKILIEGKKRVLFSSIEKTKDFFSVNTVDLITTTEESDIDFEAIWRNFNSVYSSYAKYNAKLSDHYALIASLNKSEIEVFIDALAGAISLKIPEKIEMLQELSLLRRIMLMIKYLKKEIEIAQAEEKIRAAVQEQILTSQREYYLNEQLKAIQKELKKDGDEDEEYRKKLKTIKLPPEVKEKVEREIGRVDGMSLHSPEAAVSRNYIDWIFMLPWGSMSKDRLSIQTAEEILNRNHSGLLKVKERILELIAAQKYSKNKKRTPVICLVGPPGVGKTSLGKSIAESLNREFVRISLGGVRDEAEIRGHRRTYVAATPGKIIQGMKKAKTINPVFLLDEVDKIARDFHGDPSAALLEVLDPELNKEFSDSFIDASYDLSNVLFILTANTVDTIQPPLLDRMELIYLSGYTKNEKIDIAERFIIPKQLEEHSIKDNEISIDKSAVELLINEYTREAGVRQLERYIIRSIRKGIKELLQVKEKEKRKPIKIETSYIYRFFKTPPFKNNRLQERPSDRSGVAVGLAWTEFGGDVLDVEVALSSGKGNITLTGQLGDVMQESAQAAYTYLKTNREKFGIPKNKIAQWDVHIHVPEGATPKDGPSAGITLGTALISAFCDIPVKKNLAMTGEITLQGNVLGIGGIKEKILAAVSYGYTTILLPKENEEICKEVLEELGEDFSATVLYCDKMDQVLSIALERDPVNTNKKLQNKRNEKRKKRVRIIERPINKSAS